MRHETKAFFSALSEELTVSKAVFFLFMILLVGNLSALVDAVLHPEIPYFDEEHLIIGGTYALFLTFMFLVLAVYIAKLKMASKTQVESEEKFRVLAEKSPNMIFINKQGRVVYANDKCSELMEYTRDEFLSPDFDFLTLIAPESLELVKDAFSQQMKGEDVPPFDYTLLTRQGRRIEVILTSKLIDIEGETAILGIITDITERKRAEDEIKMAKEEWERTFDAIVEPIMILDVNHKIVKANKAMADKLGVTASEAQGLTCYRAVHGLEEPHLSCPHSKLLADGQVHTTEIFEERLGGHYIITVSPIYDAEGRLIASIHVGLDVTDRKKVEKALKESEEKHRDIFDHARDIIFTVDMDTSYTSLNPAFEKITGWPVKDWLGKSFTPMVHPEDLPKAIGMLQRMMQGEELDMFELRVLKKSGEYFIGEFTVALIKQGEAVIALGHVRDITERKLNEEKIRLLTEELEMRVQERTRQLMKAQEELARKERLTMLGQLAGSVGHELRNPLGVISNAVYFLKTVITDTNETVKEYLNIIKDEVDNSQRIISDLLDLSRTNTPQPRAISVQELIRPSLAKCVIPENVTMQLDLPETLPDVLTDPRQMGQVFQNLITNALQAMPEGGSLQISARKVVRDLGLGVSEEEPIPNAQTPTPDRDFVEISVTDTGKGISPENIEMLFQPLFTTKARGIGLGLAISRRFAEANKGKLEVESREGKGATFIVTLPAAGKEHLEIRKK